MSAPALPRALDLTLTLVERHAALGLPTQADPQALPREESPYGIAYAAARHAGAMQPQQAAQPSTPVLGTPFWHQAPA